MNTLSFRPGGRSFWSRRYGLVLVAGCCASLLGCGEWGRDAAPAVFQEDPAADFALGMERLDRALRRFRPSVSEGLMTSYQLEHKLIPPSTENAQYTARVTIASSVAFLHGKRSQRQTETLEEKKEAGYDDLLSAEDDAPVEFQKIPGTGSAATGALVPHVESRSLDKKSVFALVYADGRWTLAQQPELKSEQLWFEYAFPQH